MKRQESSSANNQTMTKSFFIYTAIIEALTGLGLIVEPATVARLLLGAELSGELAVVLAMLAGVAIFSIALLSWLSRLNTVARVSLMVLLFYNIAVSFILVYASLRFGYNGIPLYVVIAFHLYQSVLGVVLLKNKLQEHMKNAEGDWERRIDR
jgi:hypothetical protein